MPPIALPETIPAVLPQPKLRFGQRVVWSQVPNPDFGSVIGVIYTHEASCQGTGLHCSVSFSPDGKTLASGSKDETIKLWNLETGNVIRTLTGHSSYVNSVSFSPDGKTLASGSGDQTIKLWNLETGNVIRTLVEHSRYVSSVSFSPNGKTLASGSGDQTIKLWNLPELELDPLMRRNCDLVRSYLENNPHVSESDRHLCDGIGRQKSSSGGGRI